MTKHLKLAAALTGTMLLLGACHRPPSAPSVTGALQPGEDKAGDATKGHEGVTLSLDEVAKLGIVAEAAKPANYIVQTAGYGVVLPHEAIAAAVSELTTAELTEKQTQAALARVQGLRGTPGALSAEAEDTATRQAAADTAARVLATQRLSAVIGLSPAWPAADQAARLRDMAGGQIKLLRATFPLGSVHGSTPTSLSVAHLDAVQDADPHPASASTSTAVWAAPADASVPGRSFFALLKRGDFVEGERLLVWAPGAGAAQPGALVPLSGVLLSEGKYWCYVEKVPGTYQRVEVNPDRPTEGGYFVTDGVDAGTPVVTAGAGLLLARETNSDADAE